MHVKLDEESSVVDQNLGDKTIKVKIAGQKRSLQTWIGSKTHFHLKEFV